MIDTSNPQTGGPKNRPSHLSPSHVDGGSSSGSPEKYGLRPRTIIKRLQQERVRQQVRRGSKGLTRPKSRPAPLSKYRRKTANARERHRMQEINNAFESLRRVLPEELEVEAASSNMTKITTLRLAVNYIRALSGVLEEEGGEALCSLQRAAPSPLMRAASTTPHHLLDYYSPDTHMASSVQRGSLGSSSSSSSGGSCCSDLDDLLSDDSCSLIDDSFDVFHDMPCLPLPDPFELLLNEERDVLALTAELCS